MINTKTEEQLKIMETGGKMLAEVMWEVLKHIKPGVSEIEIDKLAEKLIIEKGGEPGFKKVSGYKHTICVSTNDVVVHGIPTEYKFKEGDIVGIDCGVFYKGFHTDMSETVVVGKASKDVVEFLNVGKNALNEALKKVKPGNHVGDISNIIQEIVEEGGYSVVRSLVGHGVGRNLHEEPEVPGFLTKSIQKTPKLSEGMVIAVEVIYNQGKHDLVFANNDGWTLKTKDGSLAGLFERTVAVTKNGSLVLTK